jgi:hypothetical protein
MAPLHAQVQAAAEGHLPPEEPLAAEVAARPLALGADGVRVPCRPEGGNPRGQTAWHEVHVDVLARLGRQHPRTGQIVARRHQRRVVAVCGDRDALQRRLWLEAMRQGLRQASQVVWRSDGARGVWRLCARSFAAYATGILDLYHAVPQRWKGAAAWRDGRTSQARRWCHWARHRLRHGHPDGVLADWADALAVAGFPATARETLTTVYAYLERHREYINYEA